MDAVEERFWKHVEKTNTCWLWQSGTFSDGYGAFQVKGKTRRSHRFVWELVNGPIPEGLHVLHQCDTPRCVRPDHLFLGTAQDNMTDKCRKNRQFRPKPEQNNLSGLLVHGEHNGFAKLTTEQVGEIRRRYALGGISQRLLGLEFGIAQGHVSRIVHGVRWAK